MTDDVLGNAAYYRQREITELELAEGAPADDIRTIHLQLARRYAELAHEFETDGRGSGALTG